MIVQSPTARGRRLSRATDGAENSRAFQLTLGHELLGDEVDGDDGEQDGDVESDSLAGAGVHDKREEARDRHHEERHNYSGKVRQAYTLEHELVFDEAVRLVRAAGVVFHAVAVVNLDHGHLSVLLKVAELERILDSVDALLLDVLDTDEEFLRIEAITSSAKI